MDDKVLVKVLIPEFDLSYDIFIPINLRIGNVIELLNKALTELISYPFSDKTRWIYNNIDGSRYNINSFVRESNIRNGSIIVFV